MRTKAIALFLFLFEFALRGLAWESHAHFINNPALYQEVTPAIVSVELGQVTQVENKINISTSKVLEFTTTSSAYNLGKNYWMGIDNKSLTRTINNNFATFGKFEAFNTWPVLQWGFKF